MASTDNTAAPLSGGSHLRQNSSTPSPPSGLNIPSNAAASAPRRQKDLTSQLADAIRTNIWSNEHGSNASAAASAGKEDELPFSDASATEVYRTSKVHGGAAVWELLFTEFHYCSSLRWLGVCSRPNQDHIEAFIGQLWISWQRI